MPVDRKNRLAFIATLGSALSVFLGVCAAAQEGHYSVAHKKWHHDFYATLKRTDGTGSCCSDNDCRPTVSRKVGDHYEIKVDGRWLPRSEEHTSELQSL